MASLNLAQEELKQLEMVRNRLNQLFHSLDSLTQRLIQSNPLLSRESLQLNTTIIKSNIMSVQSIIDDNFDLFQRLAIHPSTNYPGRNKENFDLLVMLLRKKPEEAVDDYIEESLNAARAAGLDEKKLAEGLHERMNSYNDDPDDYGMEDEEDEGQSDPLIEQWADCFYTFDQAVKQYVSVQAQKNFTVAEQAMGIENVRTGLKRELKDIDDDDDEEEEDEDEDMAMGGMESGAAPGLAGGPVSTSGAINNIQPEHVLWMMARGGKNLPRYVELDANRVVKVETKRAPPPR
ncbi:mediator of RNA polymerase II transcription subunit 8 [Podospora fimiseda]|uniref:Mediator of RNA polymerase II transcription subunit 8 n=1 Tax=Podospora fimiseda TaxID=252190 RepID=A0AAN7GXG3_9PEZI|nr:mediator of RNA polymerase II transcription subunit 8 [Podospora fimiseda]